jgi:hypothetical protein
MSIKEKKAKMMEDEADSSESSSGKESPVLNFAKSMASIILFLSLYFSLGMVAIYISKLAQSNILPTDTAKSPFIPSVPRTVSEIPINLFQWGTKSNKMSFPLNAKNAGSKLISLINQLKMAGGGTSFQYFLASTLEDFIAFNYSFINIAYSSMNELLPETAVFLAGPILNYVLLLILLVIDFPYIWFKWVTNLGLLFKENVGTADSPKWQGKSFGSSMIASIIGLVVLLLVSSVSIFIPIVLFPCIIISLLGFNALLDGSPDVMGIGDILKKGIVHHKVLIASIFSLFLLVASFISFGVAGAGAGAFILLLAYFNKIATSTSISNEIIGFFQSFPQNNRGKLSSYKVASTEPQTGGGISQMGGGRKPNKGGAGNMLKFLYA